MDNRIVEIILKDDNGDVIGSINMNMESIKHLEIMHGKSGIQLMYDRLKEEIDNHKE